MFPGQLSSKHHRLPYNMDFRPQLSLLTEKYIQKMYLQKVQKWLLAHEFSAKNYNFERHWL